MLGDRALRPLIRRRRTLVGQGKVMSRMTGCSIPVYFGSTPSHHLGPLLLSPLGERKAEARAAWTSRRKFSNRSRIRRVPSSYLCVANLRPYDRPRMLDTSPPENKIRGKENLESQMRSVLPADSVSALGQSILYLDDCALDYRWNSADDAISSNRVRIRPRDSNTSTCFTHLHGASVAPIAD